MNPPRVLPPILVVDDSPEDVILLELRLAEAGVKNPVSAFTSGDGAIEFLTRTWLGKRPSALPGPCLCFFDLKMPRRSGIDLAQWVRRQPALERMTVAILTDSDEPATIENAYVKGADRFLLKYPVPEVLAELVSTAMKRLQG